MLRQQNRAKYSQFIPYFKYNEQQWICTEAAAAFQVEVIRS
jgi:hypothetical protein